jgi:hypothetical protein
MWFLFPPHFTSPPGHHPNRTVQSWYEEIYPLLKKRQGLIEEEVSFAGKGYNNHQKAPDDLYECIIRPGEMLYFPPRWMHATLNLEEYNLFVSLFLDTQLMK